MDSEVAKAIDDLSKRISVQEKLHEGIGSDGKTGDGGKHGILGFMPIIIGCIIISAAVAIVIVNSKKV